MFLNYVEKSVINGLTTAGVSTYLHGVESGINIGGIFIPLYALSFTAGFLGNLVGDAIHDNVTNNLTNDRKIEEPISLAISCLANGFTFYSLIHLANREASADYGLRNSLLTGAAGELVSAGAYYVLKNKL